MAFYRKYAWSFIAVCLLLAILPMKSLASTDSSSYLSTLPYSNPIGHNKGFEDFKGTKSIVIFGRITCGNTMAYVPYVNNFISQAGLQDEFNVLFYDVDQPQTEVASFIAEKGWENVNTFSGGSTEMWRTLRAQGVSNSVIFPVVFYVNEQGVITESSVGYKKGDEIKASMLKALGDGGVNLNETVRISVLADVNATSFEQRKADIESKRSTINETLLSSYTENPNVTAPYVAGTLTESYQQNALAALNLVRFMSGLQSVTLQYDYVSAAQHGAVLMGASYYGHTPSQPEDMSELFYKEGYTGTSKGNIYRGYKNLTTAIYHGWMADDDVSNISRVGHRRWALNPEMGATGFGEYNRLGVMYAFDKSKKDAMENVEAIAYPSGAAFPSELFKGTYPWSVTINPQRYVVADPNALKVTLSNGTQEWVFTKQDSSFDGNYMNYDSSNVGIPSNIVFRPKDIEHYKGTYKVTVEGIENLLGQKVELQYETTFYGEEQQDLSSKTPLERAVHLNLVPEALNKNLGDVINRAEFSQLAVILYEKLKGPITPTVTFTDTDDLYVRKAATIGILSGVGNGQFNPDGNLRREQAAKIVDLLGQTLGLEHKEMDIFYVDEDKISSWAKPYVYSVGANKLMTGEANNRFNPKGNYTRRQSIVTLMRVYDAVLQ